MVEGSKCMGIFQTSHKSDPMPVVALCWARWNLFRNSQFGCDIYCIPTSMTKNKYSNETATTAIASALNTTINEWIVLLGYNDEDVHLFEGR